MKARPCRLARTQDLIPPDGVAIDDGTVEMLADSIQAYGLREPIVVVGRHILHGVHRWAAAKKLGLATVEVVEDVQVESSEENEARVIVENLHRRHLLNKNLDAMRARLVEIKTAQIARERLAEQIPIEKPQQKQEREFIGTVPNNSKNPGGRPKSPKREAIQQVAKQTGRTESAVRKAIARTESVAEKRVTDAIKTGRIDNCDENQMPIPAHIIDKYDGLREIHSEMDALMRKAQALCSKVIAYGGEQSSYGQHWRELLHTVGHEARAYRPYALCPKCGGKGCNICRKVGLICEGMMERARFNKVFGACND